MPESNISQIKVNILVKKSIFNYENDNINIDNTNKFIK